MTQRTGFHMKGFISFLSLWSFLALLLSGIVIYLMPAGRVAYWTNWKLFGLTKDGWAGIHVVIAFLFIVTIALHLINNWKPFTLYFVNKVSRGIRLRKELALSVFVFTLFTIGTIGQVQPFRSLMDLQESIKDSYEEEGDSPPVPHAETMTLAKIAELRGDSVDKLYAVLERNNVTIPDPNATLLELAEANNQTPSNLYSYFEKKEPAAAQESHSSYIGQGVGRMTLEKFSSLNGLDIREVLAKLRANNIEAAPGDKLRDIASAHNLPPFELAELLTK